jgi:hypothetical protein
MQNLFLLPGGDSSEEVTVSTFWNPLDYMRATLSVSNLQADLTTVDITEVPTAGLDTYWGSGKKYFEVIIEALPTTPSPVPILLFGLRHRFDGLSRNSTANNVGARINYNPASNQFTPLLHWLSSSGGSFIVAVGGNGAVPTVVTTGEHGFVTGDRLMFALDFDNSKGWLGRNNTWINSGDPAAGTNHQWEWAAIKTLQAEFQWRFFFNCSGAVDNNNVKFKLATGNTYFPQIYTAPTGFTAVNPPATADTYAGFNLRDSSSNGGGANALQHGAADWPNVQWQTVGSTLSVGLTAFASSQALLHPGGKYYWEMNNDTATGTSVYCGIVDAHADATGGTFTEENCSWRGDNQLTASVGITVDSTGTVSYLTTDRLGFAVNLSTGKMWLSKNNTWVNSGDPAAGTNPQFTGISTNKIFAMMGGITSASRQWRIWADPATVTGTIPTGFEVPPLIEEYVA